MITVSSIPSLSSNARVLVLSTQRPIENIYKLYQWRIYGEGTDGSPPPTPLDRSFINICLLSSSNTAELIKKKRIYPAVSPVT